MFVCVLRGRTSGEVGTGTGTSVSSPGESKLRTPPGSSAEHGLDLMCLFGFCQVLQLDPVIEDDEELQKSSKVRIDGLKWTFKPASVSDSGFV